MLLVSVVRFMRLSWCACERSWILMSEFCLFFDLCFDFVFQFRLYVNFSVCLVMQHICAS